MDLLLARLRSAYPKAHMVGLSDGAEDLQSYLARRCDEHLLDFHYAVEYLSAASAAFRKGSPRQRSDGGRLQNAHQAAHVPERDALEHRRERRAHLPACPLPDAITLGSLLGPALRLISFFALIYIIPATHPLRDTSRRNG
jgi:hypothetical protein